MSPENERKYLENAKRVNALTNDELLVMFKAGYCPNEPEHLVGVPIGMHHCPLCGLMIVAGMPHPAIVWIGDFDTGHADYITDLHEI